MRYERRHGAVDKQLDNRNQAQRDRDRILYSSAFRRLAGITQVVSAREGHVFHNRLTHTLKVGQVARRIAERLAPEAAQWAEDNGLPPQQTPLDPDVVETAALAHDIGHPPFGHVAEKKLQQLHHAKAPDADSFEGNAQSFRIVTKLSKMSTNFQGLDLTRASLRAILKYPWRHDPQHPKANEKWGAYRAEEEDLRYALGLPSEEPLPAGAPGEGPYTRSLEAQVMDWADDITYAVHDVEDLYRAGLVPLDRLRNDGVRADFARWVCDRWVQATPVADIEHALGLIPHFFASNEAFQSTSSQRVALRNFTSLLIARYVRQAGTLVEHDGHLDLTIDSTMKLEVDVLKQLTWRYVIERPALAAQQVGQLRIIEGLFDTFYSASAEHVEGPLRGLLPDRAREPLEHLFAAGEQGPDQRARVVCDTICELTEDEAIRLHRRLTGISPGSVLDAIIE